MRLPRCAPRLILAPIIRLHSRARSSWAMSPADVAPSSNSVMGPRQEFLAGVAKTIPLMLGALPAGIIFGAIAVRSGLSAAAAAAMSAFVYAGSAQYVAIGLLASGAAVPVIIFTTLIVNLRHLLYAATLAPYVKHLPQR